MLRIILISLLCILYTIPAYADNGYIYTWEYPAERFLADDDVEVNQHNMAVIFESSKYAQNDFIELTLSGDDKDKVEAIESVHQILGIYYNIFEISPATAKKAQLYLKQAIHEGYRVGDPLKQIINTDYICYIHYARATGGCAANITLMIYDLNNDKIIYQQSNSRRGQTVNNGGYYTTTAPYNELLDAMLRTYIKTTIIQIRYVSDVTVIDFDDRGYLYLKLDRPIDILHSGGYLTPYLWFYYQPGYKKESEWIDAKCEGWSGNDVVVFKMNMSKNKVLEKLARLKNIKIIC